MRRATSSRVSSKARTSRYVRSRPCRRMLSIGPGQATTPLRSVVGSNRCSETLRDHGASTADWRRRRGDLTAVAPRSVRVDRAIPRLYPACPSGVDVRSHGTTLYGSTFCFDDITLMSTHAYGLWGALSQWCNFVEGRTLRYSISTTRPSSESGLLPKILEPTLKEAFCTRGLWRLDNSSSASSRWGITIRLARAQSSCRGVGGAAGARTRSAARLPAAKKVHPRGRPGPLLERLRGICKLSHWTGPLRDARAGGSYETRGLPVLLVRRSGKSVCMKLRCGLGLVNVVLGSGLRPPERVPACVHRTSAGLCAPLGYRLVCYARVQLRTTVPLCLSSGGRRGRRVGGGGLGK